MKHKPPHWQHEPPWKREWKKGPPRQSWRLFAFFSLIFGVIVLLILGGFAALLLFFSRAVAGGDTAAVVWLGACGLTIFLPMLAFFIAGRAFRGIATPLADVMNAADAVAEGDLTVRVPVYGRRNRFAQLTSSFNRMIEELQRADEQRRNLTADVAHELRTPLHIIQGNLEGVLDGVYEPTPAHIEATLEETRTLARLVDDL
ncbi:MAG TPA: HAMP domain-containing protein, partial [Anaerolineae bacterium]|nr:HAMP domain-containing protein [Anaerolineae bacterium]